MFRQIQIGFFKDGGKLCATRITDPEDSPTCVLLAALCSRDCKTIRARAVWNPLCSRRAGLSEKIKIQEVSKFPPRTLENRRTGRNGSNLLQALEITSVRVTMQSKANANVPKEKLSFFHEGKKDGSCPPPGTHSPSRNAYSSAHHQKQLRAVAATTRDKQHSNYHASNPRAGVSHARGGRRRHTIICSNPQHCFRRRKCVLLSSGRLGHPRPSGETQKLQDLRKILFSNIFVFCQSFGDPVLNQRLCCILLWRRCSSTRARFS